MKKITIEEACKQLGISRQGLNARCRKLGIKKTKVGRRSYFTTKQMKVLRGSKTPETPKKDNTERSGDVYSGDERLITRLTEENEYLRKKLDEESEKVKGSLSVIFQQTERIGKLETENSRLLPYAPPEDFIENETETERKEKRKQKQKSWWGKLFS